MRNRLQTPLRRFLSFHNGNNGNNGAAGSSETGQQQKKRRRQVSGEEDDTRSTSSPVSILRLGRLRRGLLLGGGKEGKGSGESVNREALELPDPQTLLLAKEDNKNEDAEKMPNGNLEEGNETMPNDR